MTGSIELSTRSGHVFRPTEHLRTAAARLREGAHLLVHGLPGTGKSTFVRQLILPEVRTELGLGQDYLMVLLDGRQFAHLSLEHIWGAIVAALDRSRSNFSAVCEAEGALETSYEHLADTFRGLRDHKPVLILDHCSSLPAGLEEGVCRGLLCLPKRYCPTLVVVPKTDILERDQFVPINPVLSPEQAQRFLAQTLLQLDVDRVLENELADEIVEWAGGNLSLLDCTCHWALRLRTNPLDIAMRWLSGKEGQRPFDKSPMAQYMVQQLTKAMKRPGASSGQAGLTFQRIVYETCLLDARQLFASWLKTLGEQEQLILLALDGLQPLASRWPGEIAKLISKGIVQRQAERYLLFPKMFRDHVSREPAVCSAGPFRLDLKNPRTVYVNDRPCNLSPEQACVFLRLFLRRDDPASCDELYADLHASYVHTGEYRIHGLDQLSLMVVDLELDELRRVLKVDKEIERIPPDNDAPLRGYRLVVFPEDRNG